jgi:hypothetical protein
MKKQKGLIARAESSQERHVRELADELTLKEFFCIRREWNDRKCRWEAAEGQIDVEIDAPSRNSDGSYIPLYTSDQRRVNESITAAVCERVFQARWEKEKSGFSGQAEFIADEVRAVSLFADHLQIKYREFLMRYTSLLNAKHLAMLNDGKKLGRYNGSVIGALCKYTNESGAIPQRQREGASKYCNRVCSDLGLVCPPNARKKIKSNVTSETRKKVAALLPSLPSEVSDKITKYINLPKIYA